MVVLFWDRTVGEVRIHGSKTVGCTRWQDRGDVACGVAATSEIVGIRGHSWRQGRGCRI